MPYNKDRATRSQGPGLGPKYHPHRGHSDVMGLHGASPIVHPNVGAVHTHAGNQESHIQKQCFRTKMCSFFNEGKCNKGDKCSFAHNKDQLMEKPDFRKTRLCVAFNQKKCTKTAEQCPFAHGETDMKKSSKSNANDELLPNNLGHRGIPNSTNLMNVSTPNFPSDAHISLPTRAHPLDVQNSETNPSLPTPPVPLGGLNPPPLHHPLRPMALSEDRIDTSRSLGPEDEDADAFFSEGRVRANRPPATSFHSVGGPPFQSVPYSPQSPTANPYGYPPASSNQHEAAGGMNGQVHVMSQPMAYHGHQNGQIYPKNYPHMGPNGPLPGDLGGLPSSMYPPPDDLMHPESLSKAPMNHLAPCPPMFYSQASGQPPLSSNVYRSGGERPRANSLMYDPETMVNGDGGSSMFASMMHSHGDEGPINMPPMGAPWTEVAPVTLMSPGLEIGGAMNSPTFQAPPEFTPSYPPMGMHHPGRGRINSANPTALHFAPPPAGGPMLLDPLHHEPRILSEEEDCFSHHEVNLFSGGGGVRDENARAFARSVDFTHTQDRRFMGVSQGSLQVEEFGPLGGDSLKLAGEGEGEELL